jgi:two-component system chemotaxis response regulator CheY
MELNKQRILVVDDMRAMRTVVSRRLQKLGLTQVQTAEDGKAAWNELLFAVVKHKPFDLIISDWQMPNLTGLDLLKLVRECDAYSDIPFMLVTAETDVDQVKEALCKGADGYLVKPFTPESFEKALWGVLKHHTTTDGGPGERGPPH